MSVTLEARSKEAGVVSIFVVLFFMIFLSVLIVGYVKIVNDDQAQATDHDLSTSALEAARSGVEDAKRLLMFCQSHADTSSLQNACNQVLNSTGCHEFITAANSAELRSALNIEIDTSNGHRDGIVSGNSAYEQRYTCMSIQTDTDSVEGISVEKGKSELIPLQGTGSFSRVAFMWHDTSGMRDGSFATLPTATRSWPAESQWGDYPAAMRLDFIAYPKSGVRIDDSLTAATRTIFLQPVRASSVTQRSTYNINTTAARSSDPNTGTAQIARGVYCHAGREYACEAEFTFSGTPSPSSHNYFLRVSAVYSSSYIKVQLKSNATTIRQFDNVQPVIDVTGRTNDVFRRVQSRVQYDAGMYLPQYALEAGRICKDMIVTNSNSTSADRCNP